MSSEPDIQKKSEIGASAPTDGVLTFSTNKDTIEINYMSMNLILKTDCSNFAPELHEIPGTLKRDPSSGVLIYEQEGDGEYVPGFRSFKKFENKLYIVSPPDLVGSWINRENCGHIVTSRVVSMSGLFSARAYIKDRPHLTEEEKMKIIISLANFNDDVSHLDTSNVIDMSGMFEDALLFDRPVHTFSTSKVTNMSRMFKNAARFNNTILSDSFNTVNVRDMSEMFSGTICFNQPLLGASFYTGNVQNFSRMFYRSNSFRQPLRGPSFNMDNAENISEMFEGAESSLFLPLMQERLPD